MKVKRVVPRNDPNNALDIFKRELTPAVQDVRGQLVEVDLGDYLHAIARHDAMLSRVRWVRETLTNPEAIYRHAEVPAREIYVNTIFESDADDTGALHLVIVERRLGALKFWTISSLTFLTSIWKALKKVICYGNRPTLNRLLCLGERHFATANPARTGGKVAGESL